MQQIYKIQDHVNCPHEIERSVIITNLANAHFTNLVRNRHWPVILKVTAKEKGKHRGVLTNLTLLSECVNAGLGYCLTFLPTVTILSQYFSKRRSLVTAMASTGESFAIFAFAPGENSHAQLFH